MYPTDKRWGVSAYDNGMTQENEGRLNRRTQKQEIVDRQ